MFCKYCGSDMDPGTLYCPGCGSPAAPLTGGVGFWDLAGKEPPALPAPVSPAPVSGEKEDTDSRALRLLRKNTQILRQGLSRQHSLLNRSFVMQAVVVALLLLSLAGNLLTGLMVWDLYSQPETVPIVTEEAI